VHFLDIDRVVGCREEELQPADAPWTPSRFEFREKVAARIALGSGGRVLVEANTVGEIGRVIRGEPREDGSPGDVAYYVEFPGISTLQVPESALIPAEDAAGDEPTAAPGAAHSPEALQQDDRRGHAA
jgi:nitrogen fixation protein NifZ